MDQSVVIQKVLALTGEIEHAAALADWPQAARLAETRSSFVMSLRAPQSPAALKAIREIMTRDAAILSDAHTTQTDMQAELAQAMGRANSVSQYHSVARL